MKYITILIAVICLFVLTAHRNQTEKDQILKISERGLDGIYLGKSTAEDLISFYKGRFDFMEGKFTRHSCWADSLSNSNGTFRYLYNKEAGLDFVFAYNSDRLSQIRISNVNGAFENGIKIGKSTKDMVVDVFKVDSSIVRKFVKNYLEFTKDSIDFEFDFNDVGILNKVKLKKLK